MRPLLTSMAYTALTDVSGGTGRGRAAGRGRAPRDGSGVAGLRRTGAATLAVLVSLTLLAGTAQGRSSVFLPAPSYPHSTLAIKVIGKPRAGRMARILVTGSNAPFEAGYPGSGDFIAYQLDAFAQNGNLLPDCPRSFAEELQNEVNLGISRIAQGLNEGYFGAFGIPLQFRVGPRIGNAVSVHTAG